MSEPFVPRSDPPDLTAFLPVAAPLEMTYADGRIDEAYCPYLYPAAERKLTTNGETLLIGSAGTDGIEFALKKGKPGVWVHEAYKDNWRIIADDIETFERLWLASKIRV